ncbi:MAG TPA: A24 family peptidase [Candidatus Baltobacteraceae bacterium]|nr:A24 family peptidase [Candidatus Baltobacteraceae bacterium]
MLLEIIVSAVVFGCGAYLGMQLSAMIGSRLQRKRLDRDPKQTQLLALGLTVCSTLIGGVLASRGVAIVPFVILGIVSVCLCAAWYSDVTYGFIPDYFTLIPLGLVVAAALIERDLNWNLLLSTFAAFLPFGLAALLSKGRGMGWGDSKLAALGGAILGFQMALLTFAAACLALVAVGWLRGRRAEPMAFAPYLAVAIVFGVLLRVIVSTT